MMQLIKLFSYSVYAKKVWSLTLTNIYHIKTTVKFMVHNVSSDTPHASENLIKLIYPGWGLKLDLWDCKPACDRLSHCCLLIFHKHVCIILFLQQSKLNLPLFQSHINELCSFLIFINNTVYVHAFFT